MEIDALYALKHPIESEKIGKEPAYEWIEEKLEELRQKYELSRFRVEPRDYRLKRFDKSEWGETILGQEEIGREAVGFVAVYIDKKLRMLSVFVDLKGGYVRIQKIDHNKETFLELPGG